MEINRFALVTLLNCNFLHIIQQLVNNIGNIKDLSYTFLNIVLGVSAIKGLGYLKTYKEKKGTATFTFWMQLNIRIIEIKGWLENDYNLINYLFDENSRSLWESESADNNERVKLFKNYVEETIQFIKKTPDQMPAYIGWSDDYSKFIIFLNDIVQFDICDGKDYFKFENEQTTEKRNKYCKDICKIMEKMYQGILAEQKKIEKDICS